MTFTPNPPAIVLRRLINAYTEVALCAAWLAQFGPEVDKMAHQAAADHANDRALELARGLEGKP
jgi:hypothetical protein